MFWRFGGYSSISAIDTLLDKPDVTHEEVLDESELMSELRQSNSKLVDYLRRDEILKRLLDYVVSPSLMPEKREEEEEEETKKAQGHSKEGKKEGAEGRGERNEERDAQERDGKSVDARQGDHDNGQKQHELGQEDVPDRHRSIYEQLDDDDDEDDGDNDPLRQNESELNAAEEARLRYAYIACEILSSTTWSITESLLNHEQYLLDFWQFLARPAPLDSLQSGYFTKVNEALLECKTAEMLAFFRSMEGIVRQMLVHVDNPMIMDLLLKIISLERAEGGMGIVEWIKSQDLIPTLLSFLNTEYPFSVQTSAGDFLKAIIAISANAAQGDPTIIGPNSLTRQLVSRDCVRALITSMLKGGNPLTVGVGIVIEVIRKNNSDYDPDASNPMPSVNDPIYLGALLRLFARHVPDFMKLILADTTAINDGGRYEIVPRKQLHTAAGLGAEALGFDRFKTCELMAELLHCSNMGLLNELGTEDYIRRRDAEREKLVNEGVMGVWRDSGLETEEEEEDRAQGDSSAFMYGDNSAEFVATGAQTPSSVLATSASSDRLNQSDLSLGSNPEAAETGTVTPSGSERGAEYDDDDGFEDVSIMRDELERSEKGGYRRGGAEAEADAGLGDLVDEPLTPPERGEESFSLGYKFPHSRSAAGPASSSVTARPETPTDELTDRLESLSLDPEGRSDGEVSAPVSTSTTPPETPVPAPAVPAAISTTPPSVPSAALLNNVEQQSRVRDQGPDDEERALDDVDLSKYNDPLIQVDVTGQPVIGDYLKITFVENRVVPTILSFFFRFPWNNFLHNVVFDVIQQVLSGPMDRGFNRSLAIDVFVTGRITNTIVSGQQRSDVNQKTKNMRLGYMGHLTLIAEEVIKFSERNDPDTLGPEIMEKVVDSEWVYYVENTLSDTRERDNAILGGVRPDLTLGNRQAVLNAVNASQGLSASAVLGDDDEEEENGANDLNDSGYEFMNPEYSPAEEEDDGAGIGMGMNLDTGASGMATTYGSKFPRPTSGFGDPLSTDEERDRERDRVVDEELMEDGYDEWRRKATDEHAQEEYRMNGLAGDEDSRLEGDAAVPIGVVSGRDDEGGHARGGIDDNDEDDILGDEAEEGLTMGSLRPRRRLTPHLVSPTTHEERQAQGTSPKTHYDIADQTGLPRLSTLSPDGDENTRQPRASSVSSRSRSASFNSAGSGSGDQVTSPTGATGLLRRSRLSLDSDSEHEESGTTGTLRRSQSHSGRTLLSTQVQASSASSAAQHFPQPPTNPEDLPEDDEDDLIGEPLGYSSFFSPAARWGQEGYYGTVERAEGSAGEEEEDDEEDDDDLVEIMVRSRRSSSAASHSPGRDSR